MEFFAILLSIVLVNNYLFTPTTGLPANPVEFAKHLTTVLVPVLTFSFIVHFFVIHWIVAPLELAVLNSLVWCLIVTATSIFASRFIEKKYPMHYRNFGANFLPLLIFNGITLGIALQSTSTAVGYFESLLYGLGAMIAWVAALLLFASARERFEVADTPKAFRGAPLGIITAGLVSLAFMGFLGLV